MKKLLLLPLILSLTLAGFSVEAQNLVSIEKKGSIPKFLLDLGLMQYGLTARGDIDYYTVRYTMDNLEGRQDTVSGLMVRPTDQKFRYPTLVYMHGTTNDKYGVPSLSAPGTDPSYLAATQGYVALAPDFLNMGDDQEGFHPYVHLRTEAYAGIRMMQALQNAPAYAGGVNSQLYLTGYSQGGHASMAMHKVLIEEFPNQEVTAAAHLSGPYSLSGIMKDSVILKDKTFVYFGFLPYTVLSYQAAYPSLEQDLSKIFRAPYLPIITAFRDGYANGTITLDSLNRRLLSLYVGTEGNQTFYPSRLLLPAFANALGNPDNPFVQALRANDTYTFTNPTPTRLFYCRADDQVNFRNALVAEDSLRARGATRTEAIDVNPTASHTGCVNPALRATFSFFAQSQMIVSGVEIAEASNWEWAQTQDGLRIFPNDDATYRLRVVDAIGRTVLEQNYQSGEFVSTRELARGFTVVRLFDAKGRSASRSFVLR